MLQINFLFAKHLNFYFGKFYLNILLTIKELNSLKLIKFVNVKKAISFTIIFYFLNFSLHDFKV